MYTALYRTERPETFDEILGQGHIVRILKNQVKTGTVSHAYLFTGTRGTGKTSTARILAKAVNCTGDGEKPCCSCPSCLAIKEGSFIDMIEIDAASNNGVDSVRELRESVNYPPAVGKKKVYIIDEAHMLTTQALNALLKTLEEPPENVMFILATTDPQKLLQTILSRCLRLDFRRIPDSTIAEHMDDICKKRGVNATPDALKLLASNADGSVRDGLSLLDQCLSGGTDTLDRDTVLEYLGTVSDDFFIRLTECVSAGDPASGIVLLDEVLREGKDVKLLISDWLSHYRSLLVSKYVSSPENILNMSTENVKKLITQSKSMDVSKIEDGILTLSKTVNDARYSSQPRILLELAVVMLSGAVDRGQDWGNEKNRSVPQRTGDENSRLEKEKNDSKPEKDDNGSKSEAINGIINSKVTEPLVETGKSTSLSNKTDGLNDALNESDNNPDNNLNEIWEEVWDIVGSSGSMIMVKLNTYLAGMNNEDFKVIVTNTYAKEQAEKNADAFTDAMEKVTGKRLKMVLTYTEPDKAPVKTSVSAPATATGSATDTAKATGTNTNTITATTTTTASTSPKKEFDAEHLAKEMEEKFNIKPRIE